MPIRYVNQGYPRAGLAGFYRAAEIGLITPLRDGMNLVAKEYVAAQDPDDPGVLILSRFAGAAHQLQRGDPGQSLQQGGDLATRSARRSTMPKAERVRRWRALNETVRARTCSGWRKGFVEALAGENGGAPAPVPPRDDRCPALRGRGNSVL